MRGKMAFPKTPINVEMKEMAKKIRSSRMFEGGVS